MTPLPGLLKALGFAAVLVGAYADSLLAGLLAGILLILLGDAVWARERLAREGVVEDERDRWVRLRASSAALTAYTASAGVLVAATVVLEDAGRVALEPGLEGLVRGLGLSVFLLLALQYAAGLYYSRRGGV